MREVLFGGENKQKIAVLQAMHSHCAVPSSSVMQSSSCDSVSTPGANQAVVWQEGAVSGVTLTLNM